MHLKRIAREVNIQVHDERRAIRNRLGDNRLTFVWLIDQLHMRGIVTDKTELSSVFAGTRNGPKAKEILSTSELILNEYETKFAAKAAT